MVWTYILINFTVVFERTEGLKSESSMDFCRMLVIKGQCHLADASKSLIRTFGKQKDMNKRSAMKWTSNSESLNMKSLLKNLRRVFYRYWLRFCHDVILISNVRISTSIKANWRSKEQKY